MLHTLSPHEARIADRLLEDSSNRIYPRGSNPDDFPNPRFPPAIKKFFSRLFKKHPSALNDPNAHRVLVSLVVDAARENRLFSTNWEAHPAPDAIKALNPIAYIFKAAPVKKTTKSKKDTAPKTSDSGSEVNEVARSLQEKHITLREVEEHSRLNDRIKRFKPINEGASYRIEYQPPTEQNRADVIDWDDSTIIGTCLKHEKSYFRLTSEVDPSTVRPLRILQEWTEILLEKWEKTKDYRYILDQFQAIRQDLTVQRIKNPFAVNLYETVARFALENGDLGEFNKCQTKLIELYSYGIKGNECEFISYRILYYLHTRSQSDINKTLTQLTQQQKSDAAIKHALQLRSAISSLNYVQFFQLYQSAPNLGRFMINHFLERERIRAMCIICTSFRQTITVDYICSRLGFETTEDCLEFLKKCDIAPNTDQSASDYMTFSTRPVLSKVQALSSKFSKVDLKGQIN
ncbi:hypothetical protein DSO57_1009227 [Entomophthora muscae]|uniref:Uncharacterized protein n=1 Tax=Entomophthora muscae TaxID=34485 RepID=A0ACC2THW7_9FUNG|nr:hypothetical protein DSO57_1009227 [Entomophthora muscae]